MQRLVGLLRRVRERPPSGSASAPCAAPASELQENGRGGLHSAAANGDLARLQRRWWWKRLRINRRDANKQTPLHLACVNGHADVVRFLAEKKCQLNPRDNFNKSPLMKAVERQHKDCAAILLKHGANPDLKGSGGNTALHLAALIPSKSLVELLLEHNADIEAKNKLGYTPLAVAIMERCEEMVEFLLQKGANVHAQDNHKRTPFMLAAVMGDLNLIRRLLRHGANVSQEDGCGHTAMHYASFSTYAAIKNELEQYMALGRTEECSAEGSAVLASSPSGTAADSPLGAPALTGAVRILHHGGGVLPAAGAEQEDHFDSSSENEVLSLLETDSEGPREVLADVRLPAAGRHGVCAQPLAEERGNGVLPTAAGAEQEEDDDSPFDSETDSEGPREVLADVRLPAAGRHGVCAQPLAEERGNGVLPAATGAEQEEDDDSPFDSETDSEGPMEVLANVRLPAAGRHGVCAQSLAEERGNGVLPTAAGAEQEEDDDSPFDSETDSEGPREVLADVRLPAAGRHGVCAQPLAEERGNGVLPAATGAEQEEDDDSPFDSETDSEGPMEVLANVRLPAAGRHGVCAQSLAEERGNGVLPTAAGAEQEEDDDSPFDSETDSEGPREVLADVRLPAAGRHGVCAQPLAEERGNGVLPAATGAEQEEDDDSPFDSETDSEGPMEVLADVRLPAAGRHGVCAQPLAEERSNGVLPTAAGAEQEEDFDSSSENEVSALGREELLLKKDASTQADCQSDRQRWVMQLVQELADALKKKSLAEASLEAKERCSRDLQEEKLQLQKELDRSKAKLQELKERRIRTECYAESLKNAIKNKERELTTSMNLWGLLVASSGTAAIPELEERMQRLQVGKARLKARAQQQAKTIEALQKDLQASTLARNGLEDSITGFQTTRAAKEHQHRQCGSESKEVKKLAEMKRRSEALLNEMRGKNIALKEERTRLKMLLEGFQTKLMAYAGRKREPQLSFRREMKSSCSEVASEVGKLRRKQVTNVVLMAPHLTDFHRITPEPPTR
ncbi:uncharacterized protein LOC142083109 [Calonectris borealis]|uniref:uncharacterized protein LOC142083109 n=1 Tax=Calonectris borealis TaxID=1323832 RepID=UPI003F4B0F10